jgi:hypothetical protein
MRSACLAWCACTADACFFRMKRDGCWAKQATGSHFPPPWQRIARCYCACVLLHTMHLARPPPPMRFNQTWPVLCSERP